MTEVKIENQSSVWLRAADETDMQLFFSWRNDPWIISKGKSGREVSWEEHSVWYEKAIRDRQRCILVILVDHCPNGAVFLHCEDEVVWISLYFLREVSGRGLGAPVISASCRRAIQEWPAAMEVRAEILNSNEPSLKVFDRAGFTRRADDGECSIFTWAPDAKIEQLPHNRPVFNAAEVSAANDAVSSGIWVNGPWSLSLESRFSEWKGSPAIIGDSGSSALRMALRLLEIPAGAEVIVPAYSCVALPNAVLAIGARPVPVDVEAESANICMFSARNAITERSMASIAINTFGRLADSRKLKKATGLPVIEDGSHGFSIGEPLCGDLAFMSLYATKLMGCGQGGVVWVENDEQKRKVSDFRDYTDKMPSTERENARISEMEAAIAYRQMDKLPAHIEARRRLSEAYSSRLKSTADNGIFSLPKLSDNEICYRYVLHCATAEIAQHLHKALAADKVTAERPVEPWLTEEKLQNFPKARRHYEVNLSLPLFPSLDIRAVQRVCQSIKRALDGRPF